ncbi:uncharacterized protein LOC124380000 [Silurus meridionalis]|uniref:uncharacterized protein LOC124380000 n=1 Tax=Silurus meridionalis TaxID=175797 RepID=UPI001EEC10E9|nr:uncharacterized protein LOC124380000 [Silurus meridionalis]
MCSCLKRPHWQFTVCESRSRVFMMILHIHFYLLVCCSAAEGFTEKLVDLGQNVTLQCEVAVKHMSWYLMKPSEPPVYILRSFSSKTLDPEYSNRTFSKIFSLQYNSSLFIHNISTNELGVYYCIQCGSPPNISRGIRLYTQNHAAVPENQTSRPGECNKGEEIRLWRNFLIILGMMNCMGLAAVTVSIVSCCGKTKSINWNGKLQEVTESQSFLAEAHYESIYTAVQFHPVM